MDSNNISIQFIGGEALVLNTTASKSSSLWNMNDLPSHCKALVLRDFNTGPEVESIPTPQPGPGSAVVEVLCATLESQMAEHIKGAHPMLKLAIPLVPGYSGVGRVAAVGPDTVSLQVGQLVVVEPFVRGRDDTSVRALWGIVGAYSTPEMKKLVEYSWRDGMWAEYASVPLENCIALNEKVLLGSPNEGGLGYDIADLTYLPKQMIAYGGWRDIDLKAGETVIVAPATGGFSGAAVEVASAMGAQVIAAGRNIETLKRLAENLPRVKIVQITGDIEQDAKALSQFGPVDAFMEYSPHLNFSPTHIKSAMMALKPYGRVSLMGGLSCDIPISYWDSMTRSLTIKGKCMYEREDARGTVKLAEAGLLKMGKSGGINLVGRYKLEDWKKAIDTSGKNAGWGQQVIFDI